VQARRKRFIVARDQDDVAHAGVVRGAGGKREESGGANGASEERRM